MIFQSSMILIQQIVLLFILIGVGFLAGHFQLADEKGARQMTDLVLYIFTPALIFTSFQVSYDPRLALNMLIAGLLAFLTVVLGVLFSKLLFRHEADERQRVLTFSTTFFNAGFFMLPLLRAVLGDIAVIYGSIFVSVFNVLLWTYGVRLMDHTDSKTSLKSLLNPSLIAVALGALFFALNWQVPALIESSLSTLAKVQSPLAMMVIGVQFYGYRENFRSIDGGVWKTFLGRNLLVPLVILPLAYLLTKDAVLFIACVLSAASPTAANAVLFATKYRRDVNLAIKTVMLTTLLEIVTLPLIMWLATQLLNPF